MKEKVVEEAKDAIRRVMTKYGDRPQDLSLMVDDMEKDEQVKDFFSVIRHPLLQRHKFLGFLYMLMQMFLSAIFLVSGLVLVIPSSEQEFQSAIGSLVDVLLSASVRGTRLLAFLLGLALLIMCIVSLSNAGEMLRSLGLTGEE